MGAAWSLPWGPRPDPRLEYVQALLAVVASNELERRAVLAFRRDAAYQLFCALCLLAPAHTWCQGQLPCAMVQPDVAVHQLLVPAAPDVLVTLYHWSTVRTVPVLLEMTP